MDVRDCIVSVTTADVLYACVPLGGGRFTITRCGRSPATDVEEARQLEGILLGVAPADLTFIDPGATVRWRGQAFAVLAGSSGLPVLGRPMAVGGTRESVEEITAPVREIHALGLDRAWAIPLVVKAFRNHDRAWRQLLSEGDYEQGDEALCDDDDEALGREAREACYRRRLARKGAERNGRARRFGHVLRPTVIPVSNEELAERLEELACGTRVASAPVSRWAVA